MYNSNYRSEEEEARLEATGKRLNVLFTLIFVALAILVGRLSFVQLGQGSEFLAKAETNRYIEQEIDAPRGLIYDRDHNLLVDNRPAYTITYTILSEEVQDAKSIATLLAPVFQKKTADVLNLMDLNGQHFMLSVARKLFTNATQEQIAFVQEHQTELPGVNVVLDSIRDYKYKNFASHILGYLNNIPQDYWSKHRDEYAPNDQIGFAGVEKSYEPYLRGQKGRLKVEVNIYNQPLHQQRSEDPTKGHDIVLTLNSKLQRATEQALAERVQALHRRIPTVKHGAAIALDPKTGEVLAMASYPSYDPNLWIKGLSQKEYEEQFAPAEMNRAIQQVYQPGSTIKMATELIGMKEGVISPWTVFNDPGRIQVGYQPNGEPNYIKSWKPMGWIDAYRAIAESSNVYMIRTFLNLGGYREDMPSAQVSHFLRVKLPQTMNKIIGYHKELGMGPIVTGVDLPYEAEGQLTQEGYVSDLAFAAIGQTEKYTLLQMAQYVATIANNGTRMKPHLVREIISPDGKQTTKVAPVLQNKVSFTQAQLDAVQRGMHDVTHKAYGTFYSVFGRYPIDVAGKTGTAETGRGTENSVFVGYAPYDDPKIAIAIILPDNEKQSHSSESLGPVARAMMDTYFNVKIPKFTTQSKSKTKKPIRAH
ncbi:MAG TPA: penicillin-binding transpeptidase domain-containing protein [Bacilli bacterium]|nr:penicillin-binding transpeptidase domain-containing protein [Bacilli bacterium]